MSAHLAAVPTPSALKPARLSLYTEDFSPGLAGRVDRLVLAALERLRNETRGSVEAEWVAPFFKGVSPDELVAYEAAISSLRLPEISVSLTRGNSEGWLVVVCAEERRCDPSTFVRRSVSLVTAKFLTRHQAEEAFLYLSRLAEW